MFVLRSAGLTLLVYALFSAAFGLNGQELPWFIAAVLLSIGGIALLAAKPWSRIVVLSSTFAAVVVGAISQIRTAQQFQISLESATVSWALWSALWLATAYIGSRYLSDQGAVREDVRISGPKDTEHQGRGFHQSAKPPRLSRGLVRRKGQGE